MKHLKHTKTVLAQFATKWGFFIILFCLFSGLQAQDSAFIEYKQTIFARKMLPPEQKQYAMMIPEKMESKVELKYNKALSSTQEVKENNGTVDISMGGGEKSFYDLDAGKSLTLYPKNGMVPKNFAIEGNLDSPSNAPTFTGNTQMILGYECKEATYVMDIEGVGDGKLEVKAYITEEIPYGHSPMGYIGFKGILLRLESEYFVYEALKLEKGKQDIAFEVPADYKKITQEQFQDIMDEAMEGMGY